MQFAMELGETGLADLIGEKFQKVSANPKLISH
jgi:hypothetical protein